MAATDGNGVSKNVRASYVKDSNGTAHATGVTVDGRPIDPDKTYRVATIDYLAKGGDYMTGFTRGKVSATSDVPVFDELTQYITDGKGRTLGGDPSNRWSVGK